jgi:TonB family protein
MGTLAGRPAISVKAGEPGTMRVGSGATDGFELTLWVTPQAKAQADTASTPILADVRTPPRYPAQALRDGIQGEVQVEFEVDATGVVRNPRVLQADPPGVFDEAALAAVRGWWLNPQNLQQPLPASMQAPIRFEMRD